MATNTLHRAWTVGAVVIITQFFAFAQLAASDSTGNQTFAMPYRELKVTLAWAPFDYAAANEAYSLLDQLEKTVRAAMLQRIIDSERKRVAPSEPISPTPQSNAPPNLNQQWEALRQTHLPAEPSMADQQLPSANLRQALTVVSQMKLQLVLQEPPSGDTSKFNVASLNASADELGVLLSLAVAP